MKDEQVTQILRAINDVREDVRDFKGEMNKRWDENAEALRRLDEKIDENSKRIDETNNKLDETNKKLDQTNNRLDETNKKVDENTRKIERNYRGLFKVFDEYERSTENYYQENKAKITAIQKKLKLINM